MHLSKRFLMLALAAMAVAAFAVPASASAHSGTCVFEGVAGNISPGVMLVGGSGDYDFSTPAGSETTKCEMDGSGMQTSSIASVGQFTNTVCGTGTAWSGFNNPVNSPADSTTINAGGGTAEITSSEYTIDFRASQGTLKITKVNGSTESGGDDVDGHVMIVPKTGDCRTGVTSFDVAGALHAEWP